MKINIISNPEYCSATIYKLDRSLSATAEANPCGLNKWLICRVLVNPPDQRNKGIGTKLLDKLIRAIKKQGGKEVLVAPGGYSSDLKAQKRFYTKFGFKRTTPRGLLKFKIEDM